MNLHSELNMRKSERSKNILIVCRSVKDAYEAMKGIISNYDGICKINKSKMRIEMGERNIIFMPISRTEMLTGLKYREYYLEDEYKV